MQLRDLHVEKFFPKLKLALSNLNRSNRVAAKCCSHLLLNLKLPLKYLHRWAQKSEPVGAKSVRNVRHRHEVAEKLKLPNNGSGHNPV